jgi:cardiolipin synthase
MAYLEYAILPALDQIAGGSLKARHIPNVITVGRILLVYPVVSLLLERRFEWAFFLFVVAGLSDAVDGLLAKYYHWQSRLGSYLDPIADKLLLISCYVTLSSIELIPTWLTVTVVLRDIVIFSGAIGYYFLLRPFEGEPLLVSKLNTLMQLVLIFLVLFHHGWAPLPATIFDLLIGVVCTTTLLSGGLYVYIWGNRYYRETHPLP